MAKPALKPHEFKKGKSGNPKGRPPMTPEQRELKSITVKSHCDIITKVLTGSKDELVAMLKDPSTPMIQIILIQTCMMSAKKGDYSLVRELMEQIIGKIPVKVQVESNINANVNSKVQVLNREALRAAMDELEKEV